MLDADFARVNRLLEALPRSVAAPADLIAGGAFQPIPSSDAETLARLGITTVGAPALFLIAAATPGSYRCGFSFNQPGCVVVLGQAAGTPMLSVRMLGANSLFIAPDLSGGVCWLQNVFMRSPNQSIYWGRKATAVQACIEIEGDGCQVVVGDDCMLSNGVWIRNYDMHTIFDLLSREPLNKPGNAVIERHVWLGQEALLVGGVHVCAGSVVGAKSLVKGVVPPNSAVGGMPAKVIRSNVGWSRCINGIDDTAQEFYAESASLTPVSPV